MSTFQQRKPRSGYVADYLLPQIVRRNQRIVNSTNHDGCSSGAGKFVRERWFGAHPESLTERMLRRNLHSIKTIVQDVIPEWHLRKPALQGMKAVPSAHSAQPIVNDFVAARHRGRRAWCN